MSLPPDLIDLLAEFAATGVDEFQVAGVSLWVVGRTELVRLKRASGRPQDLVDATKLEELD